MISVRTNVAAMVAVQALASTEKDLTETTGRVNTGLKVARAADDGIAFAAAQGLRGRLNTQAAIRDGLDRASLAIDAGLNAAESVGKILASMRDKASAAAAGGLTSAQVAAFAEEFSALRDQIDPIIASAGIKGLNLVAESTTTMDVHASDAGSGGVIVVSGHGLTMASLGLSALAFDTPSNAVQAIGAVSAALSTANAALASLGAKANSVDAFKKASLSLSDIVEKGIGLLVDADLPRESVRLSALRTKQDLGVQALSIANQTPQLLAQLFRS